jgi:RND superfamily putative drug exporter
MTILLFSMLVLLVAFRSLLIPLQAAVTNFLTAMAAFGIVTAVFQWGWGISVVRVDTAADSVPIASYVPLMMFAVLFGLSMDYQVFLLSSVDRFRAEGEGDRSAVRLGLKSSARVIAAAALIMISVFSSFVLNGDPIVKQFGVGLASAVLLAATMVLMLAPAVLTLLGGLAWWLPDGIGRLIPNVDIEGTSLGEPEMAAAGDRAGRAEREAGLAGDGSAAAGGEAGLAEDGSAAAGDGSAVAEDGARGPDAEPSEPKPVPPESV